MLMLLARRVISRTHAPLEAFQSLRRNDALDLWTTRKAEPEKLPFMRSRYRTLCLIHLELKLCVMNRMTLSITR